MLKLKLKWVLARNVFDHLKCRAVKPSYYHHFFSLDNALMYSWRLSLKNVITDRFNPFSATGRTGVFYFSLLLLPLFYCCKVWKRQRAAAVRDIVLTVVHARNTQASVSVRLVIRDRCARCAWRHTAMTSRTHALPTGVCTVLSAWWRWKMAVVLLLAGVLITGPVNTARCDTVCVFICTSYSFKSRLLHLRTRPRPIMYESKINQDKVNEWVNVIMKYAHTTKLLHSNSQF